MQKVLYIIDTLQTGGAERSTLDIAAQLTDYQPVVCQLYQKDELSQLYNDSGIKFENLQLTGRYEFVKAVSQVRKLIQKHRPALVIGTLMRAEIVARIACRIEKVPVLGTFVNDTYSPAALDAIPLLLRIKIRFFQFLNAYTAKYCSAFIANSQAVKLSNAAALHIQQEKIIVIHRGRDINVFSPKQTLNANATFKFVNVGRLLDRKGQLDLINAFYLFDQQMPGNSLTIAGEGSYRSTLEKAIKDLQLQDKVKLVGNIKNVASLLQSADCFIFPSHYEGFSGALVEAALMGVPVIASGIAMNKEVMPDDGCLFFKVKDPAALASCMQQFCLNTGLAESKAKNSQAHAMEHFNIKHIASLHEKVYMRFAMQQTLQPA